MKVIRIVSGTGRGRSELSSYDAALADAGIADFNLVTVSSIIPEGTAIEVVEDVPELGAVGDRLVVVQAVGSTVGDGTVTSGIGWIRTEENGKGVFIEEADETDTPTIESRIDTGLDEAAGRRDWPFVERRMVTESTTGVQGKYTTSVVVAIYGHGRPMFPQ